MSSLLDPMPPPPSAERRRGHRGGRPTRAVLLLAVAVLIIAGSLAVRFGALSLLPGSGAPRADGEGIGVAEAGAGAPGATRDRGACLDPTASSGPAFAVGVRNALAEEVRRWAGPEPRGNAAISAVPGLELTVRTVSDHSAATDQPMVHVSVPAVPGLAAAPTADDRHYGENKGRWNAERRALLEARAAALAAAGEGAAAIRALPLDRTTRSGISGCIAAVADTTSPGPDRRLLLASDLVENRPAQTASFAGSPVTLVLSCPAGSEQECSSRAQSWTTRLTEQGAGEVSTLRADVMATGLHEWITS